MPQLQGYKLVAVVQEKFYSSSLLWQYHAPAVEYVVGQRTFGVENTPLFIFSDPDTAKEWRAGLGCLKVFSCNYQLTKLAGPLTYILNTNSFRGQWASEVDLVNSFWSRKWYLRSNYTRAFQESGCVPISPMFGTLLADWVELVKEVE